MFTTLTPKNLAILYDMACKLPPFDKFKMPKSSKITFKVVKNPSLYGAFDEIEMAIEISRHSCGHFSTIFATLLHEMLHLALYVRGDDDFDLHEKKFQRYHAIYAAVYNLDPKAI